MCPIFLAVALPLYSAGDSATTPEGVCHIEDETGRQVCVVSNGVLRHADLGGRFGAYRCVSDQGTNWFAYLPAQEVKPCPWIGTGVHASHGWRKGDVRLVDAIAKAGIGIVRVETSWSECEKTKKDYHPCTGLDDFVIALCRRNVAINMLVCYGNRLYDNPLDPDAFSDFCAWTAGHYRDWIRHYEIWNEPQNFWFPQTYGRDNWLDKFVLLTEKAKKAIRVGCPIASVGVAAEDVESWLDAMIRRRIADKDDCITFHPYCHRQHRPEREYFLKDFGRKHRAMAEKHGGASRFAITEAGWTTYSGTGTYWQVAGSFPKASYSGQADCLVRFYLAALAAGVEFACQYDFKDDGLRRDYTEHNFGLMFGDFSPKPAYAAVATLARMVGTMNYAGRLEDDSDRYRVMRFVEGERNVLVCWAVEGECLWRIPKEALRARQVDLYGNDRGGVGGRDVLLSERPFYLVW